MTLNAIETLLKNAIGLNAVSIGSQTVERAVRKRMHACGIDEPEEYLRRLQVSLLEMDQLIEQVVIPETWFFRDRTPFDALRRFIGEEWLPAHRQGTLRVLSVPCSTGEEPYSVAIALLEAGLTPERIEIDAVDVSGRAIEHARRGVYSVNSFRGDDIEFRDRYFTPLDDHYELSPAIRERVSFHRGNLLQYGFMTGLPAYDVVFCRNLLIYFDRPTQEHAIRVLERLLTEDGLLFLGHAETGLMMSFCFSSVRYPKAFAFRKRPDERRREENRNTQVRQERRKRPTRRMPVPERRPRRAAAAERPSAPPAAETPAPAENDLDAAYRLADEGHLVEAAKACEAHLRRHNADARAFYLLGVVREATGNREQAEEFLRKAIYLDPNHHEALSHLALLVEHQGDNAAAALLRQRADRARARGADDRRAGA